MARAKKTEEVVDQVKVKRTADVVDDFTHDLITSLNKEHGSKIAYNLSTDQSPTHVKRWISSGSRQLDYIMSNRAKGGAPEGRIIEIFGPPSIGKSHIATQFAKSTQQMGGIVVYIDTENATSVDNLAMLGVDVSRRFVYIDTHCTEEVLSIAESTILKAKAMSKNIPVTIIWDSVAASSPKAELLGDYDQQSIGLQARAISKGMRKITGVIANQNVLLICLNQIRTAIGVMHGDPTTVPGGRAIPFHASVRIKLGAGQQIKDSKDNVLGIHVSAKTIKNKVAPPFRSCNFEIHFGKGIVEHEEIFDVIRSSCDDLGSLEKDGMLLNLEGKSAWKTLSIANAATGEIVHTRKFYKTEFGEIMKEEAQWIDPLFDRAMIRTMHTPTGVDVDENSYEELTTLAEAGNEALEDLEG